MPKIFLFFKRLIPAFLGAIAALALPPTNFWLLIFILVPTTLKLFADQNTKPLLHQFFFGWLFGFGYFLAAMHWIGYAFFVDAASDLWMMPFALSGLSAFLALYWGLAFAFASILVRRGHPVWLALPPLLAIAELLRGILFTGFPWSVWGQMVDGMGVVAQLASVIGMIGLTLFILLWAAAPFGIWRERGLRRAIAVLVLISLPVTHFWGEWRLSQNPTHYKADVMLRLVQPNIAQNDKWRSGNARVIFNQLLQLTAAPSSTGKPVTHIMWPEASVPFLIDESPEGRAELAKALQPGQTLMAGAVRRERPTPEAHYFTSILMFNDKAEVIGHYDKWRLVPGGEFLPLEWALAPLGFRRLVNAPESFTPGEGPKTMAVPGAGLAGFSVCYEAIFPGGVAATNPRPDWLVNVTNDGWFGTSTGPYQHLAMLRLRAIELGVPAARAANTGISAVIDPLGRMTFTSQLNAIGSFDFALPTSLGETVYVKFGEILFVIVVFTLFLVGDFLRRV